MTTIDKVALKQQNSSYTLWLKEAAAAYLSHYRILLVTQFIGLFAFYYVANYMANLLLLPFLLMVTFFTWIIVNILVYRRITRSELGPPRFLRSGLLVKILLLAAFIYVEKNFVALLVEPLGANGTYFSFFVWCFIFLPLYILVWLAFESREWQKVQFYKALQLASHQLRAKYVSFLLLSLLIILPAFVLSYFSYTYAGHFIRPWVENSQMLENMLYYMSDQQLEEIALLIGKLSVGIHLLLSVLITAVILFFISLIFSYKDLFLNANEVKAPSTVSIKKTSGFGIYVSGLIQVFKKYLVKIKPIKKIEHVSQFTPEQMKHNDGKVVKSFLALLSEDEKLEFLKAVQAPIGPQFEATLKNDFEEKIACGQTATLQEIVRILSYDLTDESRVFLQAKYFKVPDEELKKLIKGVLNA